MIMPTLHMTKFMLSDANDLLLVTSTVTEWALAHMTLEPTLSLPGYSTSNHEYQSFADDDYRSDDAIIQKYKFEPKAYETGT